MEFAFFTNGSSDGMIFPFLMFVAEFSINMLKNYP